VTDKTRGNLVNLLRAARVAADLTQLGAAKGARVPRATLARFEQGEGNVSASQLASLLSLFAARGVRVDIITGTIQIKETTND